MGSRRGLQWLWRRALAAPWHADASWTSGQAMSPTLAGSSHWAVGEVPCLSSGPRHSWRPSLFPGRTAAVSFEGSPSTWPCSPVARSLGPVLGRRLCSLTPSSGGLGHPRLQLLPDEASSHLDGSSKRRSALSRLLSGSKKHLLWPGVGGHSALRDPACWVSFGRVPFLKGSLLLISVSSWNTGTEILGRSTCLDSLQVTAFSDLVLNRLSILLQLVEFHSF